LEFGGHESRMDQIKSSFYFQTVLLLGIWSWLTNSRLFRSLQTQDSIIQATLPWIPLTSFNYHYWLTTLNFIVFYFQVFSLTIYAFCPRKLIIILFQKYNDIPQPPSQSSRYPFDPLSIFQRQQTSTATERNADSQDNPYLCLEQNSQRTQRASRGYSIWPKSFADLCWIGKPARLESDHGS